LAGQWESHAYPPASPRKMSVIKATARATSANVKSGIYHSCLNQPYVQFTQSLAGASSRTMAAHGSAAGSAPVNEQDESSG
jgi:hypothetical protein